MPVQLPRRSVLKFGAATLAAAATSAVVGPTLAGAPPARPLRILVLGGTRYLGPAFVRAALGRGHDVTLFNRGKTQPWLFPGLRRLIGNRFPEVGEGLSALKVGAWDVVVDLCAQYPRVADASTKLLGDRVGRYIMVSSVSVYASYKNVGIDETAAVRKLDRPFTEGPDLVEGDWSTYGARKAAGEALVEQRFPGRSTIVRPGPICGGDYNDGTGAYWAERLYRDRRILLPGTGSDPVQLIDVRDVADFLVLAAEQPMAGSYNLVGPAETLTLRTYIDACARVVGSSAEVVWKGDFPKEMYSLPLAAPSHRVPGFATIRNDRARAAGLKFRSLDDTIASNWVDHRARRGNGFDFAAAGIGLTKAQEEQLLASRPPSTAMHRPGLAGSNG